MACRGLAGSLLGMTLAGAMLSVASADVTVTSETRTDAQGREIRSVVPERAPAPQPSAMDAMQAQPRGALSGATIYVSAGHGWLWNESRQTWVTQRGVSHGLIEDHSNAEAVHQFLVPYLWNAGANVITVRERDMQTNRVIVDQADAAVGLMGTWTAFENSRAWGGSALMAPAIKRSELRPEPREGNPREPSPSFASFVPDIPEAGYYAVYAWYRPIPGREAARDADFVITHSGGTTISTQDLNRGHSTWRYLGTFYFEAGADPTRGSVLISNLTESGEGYVVADAIRFGGGMGIIPNPHGQTSGKPAWEESGFFYTQFAGYNPELETRPFGSVTAMPFYSEWDSIDWPKGTTTYISWHTNASQGTSRGLFTFVYSPDSWGPITNFTGIPGGDKLAVAGHDAIMRSVHKAWDPEWRDGAKVVRWLGETNPRNNGTMPAALYEVGFHDNAEDAAYILDPEFRRLASRGLYHGIVEYYNQNVPGFENTTLLPDPPRQVRVALGADGSTAVLQWNAPEADGGIAHGHAATGYKVYRSRNGYGFDNGTPAIATRFTVRDIAPGEPVYLRVTATNAGGESFPSETVAVVVAVNPGRTVLVVDAFDRMDSGLNLREPNGANRGILSRMNARNQSIAYARALAPLGLEVATATGAAITSGTVSLEDYPAVVWAAGQQGGEKSPALTAEQQFALESYVAGGGTLIVSGTQFIAELATSDHAREFVEQTLGVSHELAIDRDWQGDPFVVHAPGAGANAPRIRLNNGGGKYYPVRTMDAISPVSEDATVLLAYQGDESAPVAVMTPRADGGTVAVFGFPLEVIEDNAHRSALLGLVISRTLTPATETAAATP